LIRLLIALLLSTLLLADTNSTPSNTPIESNQSAVITQKNLYATIEPLPKRLFYSQYFDVTIKSLITAQSYKERHFSFEHGYGVKLLSKIPKHEEQGYYEYDTFTFQITRRAAKIPDFYLYLDYYDKNSSELKVLTSKPLNVITLPQKDSYCNVIAESFEVTDYHAKAYDENNNLLVFSAEATHADLGYFKLNQGIKEGFEKEKSNVSHSQMIYYVILDKKIDALQFSYFNLMTNHYVPMEIPIIVDNDNVSTQENLTPRSNQHTLAKVILVATFALAFTLFLMFKRLYWWLLLLIFPIVYISYALIPITYVCVKANSALHILPMHNSTISKRIAVQSELEATTQQGEFTKIIYHDTFGWVNNNDICSN